jgi:multisubunit Na+/H+ antiporter MnhB subunit
MNERTALTHGRRRAPRRRRGRLLVWVVVALVGLAAAFALGQALSNGPAPAGTQTIDRTVRLVTVTVRR